MWGRLGRLWYRRWSHGAAAAESESELESESGAGLGFGFGPGFARPYVVSMFQNEWVGGLTDYTCGGGCSGGGGGGGVRGGLGGGLN